MDGGLPRHIVTGGSVKFESHDLLDWSKDLAKINANQLLKMEPLWRSRHDFLQQRCYPTFPGRNSGLLPLATSHSTETAHWLHREWPTRAAEGAPFADPAIDDNGNPVGKKRITRLRQFKWTSPSTRSAGIFRNNAS